MSGRRWIALFVALALAGGGIALYVLPSIVRHVAVARVRAITGRPTAIERVDLQLLRGHVSVHGVRITERDGTTPFAEVGGIDLRMSWLPLLRGHVWIHDLAIADPTVRIVRLPSNELNISDLLGRSESTEKRFDITVDRFRVERGTATLVDLALAEPRTWMSKQMTVEAYNVSTRRGDGTAVASSVTAGAPVTVAITNLRLHPVHLDATATLQGLDLTPARVYFPPDAPFLIDRGRMTTTVTLTLDARDGVRADATARMDDLVLADAAGVPVARVPAMATHVRGFAVRDGSFSLAQLVGDGTMSVRDPTAKGPAAFRSSSIRARISDLTWPASTPGMVDVRASIPGGGALTVTGTVRPPPDPTELALRLRGMNLAPWAPFVPGAFRVAGVASADVRINEPIGTGIPAHVHGTIAVDRLAVSDARAELARARRAEAGGFEVQWPARVSVRRVVLTGPRTTVERNASGTVMVPGQHTTAASSGSGDGPTTSTSDRATPTIDIGEIVVRDGAAAWRDASVKPAARLDVTGIDATVTGAAWPPKGPLNLRLGLRPPGGGEVHVSGRVAVDPVTADVRVVTRNAALAPYQPYLPTAARVSGAADLDLAVSVPSLADHRATARGTATLSRVDVRDGERTVLRAERVAATDVDVAWPGRVTVGRLALARPWFLLERDEKGGLPLRALLPKANGGGETTDTAADGAPADVLPVTLGRVTVENGGMRIVDRAISPAFAVDVDSASVRMSGISTVEAPPAKLDLSARVAGAANLELRGTVNALHGPPRFDVNGQLTEFAVPRTNSYLINQVGWKSREGQVSAKLRARVDGDALSAKTDVRVSRLQLVRAGEHDEAQNRIGLPLGMITSLMKNRRGDIELSFAVGGRLSDPRFDFHDAMWTAIRRVAINAITLPVSWIGRVQYTADSKIRRIDVDPLPFEPGTDTLTAEGRAQVTRLATFLEALPDARLALTPVVSERDVAEITRRSAETRTARPAAPAAEGSALPVAAVAEREVPRSAITDLAKKRLKTVRTALEQAGADTSRLTEMKTAERSDTEGQIALEVMEPETERPSKVRELFRKLKGDDADR
jgi:uncharacterized protein involved in outer membrane biogenesis